MDRKKASIDTWSCMIHEIVIKQDRKERLTVDDCTWYDEASLNDKGPLPHLTLGSSPLQWIRQGQPMRWHSAGLGCYEDKNDFWGGGGLGWHDLQDNSSPGPRLYAGLTTASPERGAMQGPMKRARSHVSLHITFACILLAGASETLCPQASS